MIRDEVPAATPQQFIMELSLRVFFHGACQPHANRTTMKLLSPGKRFLDAPW